MLPKSLAVRLIAGAALWCVIALAAGGFLLSSIFRGSVERSFDAQLNVYLEALIADSEVRPDGSLTALTDLGDPRFAQVFSGWYWQIDGAKGVGAPPGPDSRSRSLWDEVIEIDPNTEVAGVMRGYTDGPDGQSLRYIAREISLPGSGLPFTFILAGDTEAIEEDVNRFATMLYWSFAVLALGLLIALFALVRLGLSPLNRVSEALAAIRSGQADRLTGDFPREIQPLADELNSLVEHNAALLERARTHVGNLAHSLKTPLSILKNDAHGQEGPFAQNVSRQADTMRRQVDHYLSRARTAAAANVLGSRTVPEAALSALTRTLRKMYADRGVDIDTNIIGGLAFRGEQEDFEEMVGNLMDNACKWASSRVKVTVQPVPSETRRLSVSVEDDGPGLPVEAKDEVMKRGARLDESVPGSGLGLSIVRDIAELYNGQLSLEESTLGGLNATIVLPAVDL